MRQQQSQRKAAISMGGVHKDMCPGVLGDVRWELSKKRVYQFSGVTSAATPLDGDEEDKEEAGLA
jgi:hypothetical protein